MLVAVVSFVLAGTLLVLLPGPDTLVILRSILRGGRRRGIATVLGIQVGLAIWVAAAILGLSAMLRASEVGYTTLRIVGAAYLVWLGIQTFRSRGAELDSEPAADTRVAGTGFRAGLLTDLLNPKVGVFFVTFLPGFVPAGHAQTPTLLLFGAIFILLNLGYQVPLVVLSTKVTALLARERLRRRLELVTGSVLVAFGLRLATES